LVQLRAAPQNPKTPSQINILIINMKLALLIASSIGMKCFPKLQPIQIEPTVDSTF